MKRMTGQILLALLLSAPLSAWSLPPEVEAEMLLREIKADTDAGRWEQAAPKFEKASRLKVKLADTFDYHWAVTLANIGDWAGAQKHLDVYLTRTGNGGKFFEQALALYSKASTQQAEQARQNQNLAKIVERIARNLVEVPTGRFMMGSPETESGRDAKEGPLHEVRIAYRLAVGKYEVTFEEWDACVADGGCGGYKPDDEGWGRGNRPVILVSWNDAKAFVKWLNSKAGLSERSSNRFRLLSEAEWEYTARAGTQSAYWWGETASHEYANYGKDEGRGGLAKGRDQWEYTAPVGSFPANPFGLHDLNGNVWEWVEDGFHENYLGAPEDGRVWETVVNESVARGGSWEASSEALRSAFRTKGKQSYRVRGVGFRLARTLP